MVRRAYKTELKPNNKQRTAFAKHAGTARFAYNWGLNWKENVHRLNQLPVPRVEYPSAIDLRQQLNKLKKPDFPWMYEVSKWAPQEALRNLDRAFDNFFRRLRTGVGKPGYPQYKSRSHCLGSFTYSATITIEEDSIKLPRVGRVRLKEHGYLPVGKVSNAVVSEKAGRWYVSVRVEEEVESSPYTDGVVGVDLGIKTLATCSDGTVFESPHALARYQRKLRRLEKEKSRRQLGSKNRKKTVRKLQRTHAQIARIRLDNLHKATTWLAKTKLVIGLEDLNVSEMLKNKKFARAIGNMGWGEFRRQLEYKSEWYGSEVVVIDRWYPSSKTCSHCGYKRQQLKLSERVFRCPSCGFELDRDLNASRNIAMVAVSSTETLNACGEESSSPMALVTVGETIPMNQESDRNPIVAS